MKFKSFNLRIIFGSIGACIVCFLIISFYFGSQDTAETTLTDTPIQSDTPLDKSLCDGRHWQKISNLNIDDSQKIRFKSMLLKISIETSALSANPVISGSIQFPEYISYIDAFYQNPANGKIPIFFALKIADMAKQGAPQQQIVAFKLAVLKQLTDANLIQ